MKLNADIIYDNLIQSVMLESYGERVKALGLGRPRFFSGANREFKPNQLYVALADRLPVSPSFGIGAMVICVGGNPPVSYLAGRCPCLVCKDSTDLFTMFNLVQQVFDKYDEWDAGMQRILDTSASIQELVDLSYPIFDNPMAVIDSNFHYLAYSEIIDVREDLALYRPDEYGNKELDKLSDSMNTDETHLGITTPFTIDSGNAMHLCLNLTQNNAYAGNLTIHHVLGRQRDSDIVLAQYLGQTIEKSFEKYSNIKSSRVNRLKSILLDLLNGYPIDSAQRHQLEDSKLRGSYACIVMKLGYRAHSKVPVGYICNLLESRFAGSVAFEYEASIVTYVNLDKLRCSEDELAGMVSEVLDEMSLQAGASYSFTDLSDARVHYRQACIAFETGSAVDPSLILYPFHNYVLPYMTAHCMGEFPLEHLLTEGVRQLQAHDVSSQANYINTLRTYFDYNMNTTKTAEALYLHRSTFLERLKRIEKLLRVDLNDPDERLRLLITLKILETNDKQVANSGEENGVRGKLVNPENMRTNKMWMHNE